MFWKTVLCYGSNEAAYLMKNYGDSFNINFKNVFTEFPK